MLKFLVLSLFVVGTYSELPPFINPCQLGDNVCLKESTIKAIPFFADGIPALSVKPLDPLKLPVIKNEQAGLTLTIMDSTLTGLKGCELEDMKYASKKMRISIRVKCNLVLTGDYKMDGKLIIMPVEGHGKYKIVINGIQIKLTSDLKTVTDKSGVPHWQIEKLSHTYNVLTGTTFQLDNLFNGNKALAEPVMNFMNKEWKLMMEEVAPPIVAGIIDEVGKNVAKFYAETPLNEMVKS